MVVLNNRSRQKNHHQDSGRETLRPTQLKRHLITHQKLCRSVKDAVGRITTSATRRIAAPSYFTDDGATLSPLPRTPADEDVDSARPNSSFERNHRPRRRKGFLSSASERTNEPDNRTDGISYESSKFRSNNNV